MKCRVSRLSFLSINGVANFHLEKKNGWWHDWTTVTYLEAPSLEEAEVKAKEFLKTLEWEQ